MKITRVRTYLCNCFRTNWVFVKLETDSGIHGFCGGIIGFLCFTVELCGEHVNRGIGCDMDEL